MEAEGKDCRRMEKSPCPTSYPNTATIRVVSLMKLAEYVRLDPLLGKLSSVDAKQVRLVQGPSKSQRTVSNEGGEVGKSVVTTREPSLPPGTVMLKNTRSELWFSWSQAGRDRALVIELVVRPGVTWPSTNV